MEVMQPTRFVAAFQAHRVIAVSAPCSAMVLYVGSGSSGGCVGCPSSPCRSTYFCVAVGIFSLLRVEFDLSVVAAHASPFFGYSVNDTSWYRPHSWTSREATSAMALTASSTCRSTRHRRAPVLTAVTARSSFSVRSTSRRRGRPRLRRSPCCSASSSVPTRRSSLPPRSCCCPRGQARVGYRRSERPAAGTRHDAARERDHDRPPQRPAPRAGADDAYGDDGFRFADQPSRLGPVPSSSVYASAPPCLGRDRGARRIRAPFSPSRTARSPAPRHRSTPAATGREVRRVRCGRHRTRGDRHRHHLPHL